MRIINSKNRLLIIVILAAIITSSFYNNRWGMIEEKFYRHWTDIFEMLVVGRLVKSQHDGIFSAGGLLVIGDTKGFDVSDRLIKHQYHAYDRGNRFKTYWSYKSLPAFEGFVYGVFDKYTNFRPGINLRIFRLGTSLFSGVVLALLLVWIKSKFGFLAFLSALISIILSPWFALLGGNLYWQLWSLYLPFVSCLMIHERFSLEGRYKPILMGGIVFLVTLMKILFSGFEFITTTLVSLTIPFVYYAIQDKWQIRSFLQRVLNTSVVASIAVITGAAILITQISYEVGDFSAGYQYILGALDRRATGNPDNYSGVYADALHSNTWSIIKYYSSGPAYALDGNFTGGVSSNSISYLILFVVFIVFSVLLFFVIQKNADPGYGRKSTALLIVTWYSILSPLSWFIVFKAHAYIHINLDYLVWQLPFTIFGFALIGHSIEKVVKIIRSE
jgi:hypothetical protein